MPEAQTPPPPLPKSQPSFGKRNSTIIKLLGVGALVLVLLIPLAMITGVLRDRLQRRNEAVADITSSWGSEQNVIGPVMGIPYQYKFKVVKEVPAPDGKMERREVEENGTAIAYFLPETLHITGDVQTQMLHRGIYDAAVFRAQVTLSGKFVPPDFGPLKIDVKDLQWKDAFVTIAVNDLRGTREALILDWGWHQALVATGLAGSRIYNRRDRVAGCRSTDCKRNRIFHSTRFQRERRNIFRAVWGAE
jgi:inner membrane protein